MESGLQSGTQIGLQSGIILAVIMASLSFGLVYNRIVGDLESSGRARGYTALLVAGGVFVSLALAGLLVGLNAFLVTLGVFALTGTPMLVGAVWRHTEERRQAEADTRAILDELRHDGRRADDVLEELRAMRRMANGTGDDQS